MTPAANAGQPRVLRVISAAGLFVDAAIHLDLAHQRPPAPPGASISQVQLFYAEGIVAMIVAGLLIVSGHRLVYALAVLVAGSALGAVLLYRYCDVGALGPLPDMYEPFWSNSKLITTIAEAVAVLASSTELLLSLRPTPTSPVAQLPRT